MGDHPFCHLEGVIKLGHQHRFWAVILAGYFKVEQAFIAGLAQGLHYFGPFHGSLAVGQDVVILASEIVGNVKGFEPGAGLVG